MKNNRIHAASNENHPCQPAGWSGRLRRRLPGRRVFFLLAAGCILFGALWRGVDNWLGKREWDRYASESAARGIRLDWDSFIPPPVPGESNFALTSSLAPLYDFIPGTQDWRDKAGLEKITTLGKTMGEKAEKLDFRIALFPSANWTGREAVSLRKVLESSKSNSRLPAGKPRSEEESAQIILSLIHDTGGEVLSEWKSASRKPFARFPVRYDHSPLIDMETPHLSVLRDGVKILALRACAQLVLNQPDDAFDDLKLALYLSDIAKNEPLEGSHARRKTCRRMIHTAILSGIARHRWTRDQLQWFQSCFDKDNFPLEAYRALQAIRARHIRVIEQIGSGQDKSTLGAVNSFNLFDELEWDLCLFLVARVESPGWFHRQAVDYSAAFDRLTAPIASWISGAGNAKTCLGLLEQRHDELLRSARGGPLPICRALWRHQLMTSMFLRSYSLDFVDCLRLQAQTQQAIASCALERYFLSHNRYPDRLENIVPEYLQSLPIDPFSHDPLKYRLDSPAACTLYSIGDNFVDDGGRTVPGRHGSVDAAKSDLVWRISAE